MSAPRSPWSRSRQPPACASRTGCAEKLVTQSTLEGPPGSAPGGVRSTASTDGAPASRIRCAPSGWKAGDGGRSGYIARPETLEFLRRIGREPLPALAESPPSVRVLREVEEICVRVRRHFLQHELRSYEVIQKTRASL